MKLKTIQLSLLFTGLATMILSYVSGGAGEAGISDPRVYIPLLFFAAIPVSYTIYWANNRFFKKDNS